MTGAQIKAVSRSGNLVAVGPPPGPRTSTLISLAGPDGVRGLRLDGNVEPEAFSTDDQVMYVLEHLPPAQADTTDLTVTRTAFGARHSGQAYALADDRRLYLAAGASIQVADPSTLASLATWHLPGQTRGLATLHGHLLAGSGNQATVLDAQGTGQATVQIPGLQALRYAHQPH
ncbi:hypothetical protein ACIBEJ_06005 [Nonomuraea sp. NPDC050790]|uniref:hypothetical protein n=1 Tax=Nonomuraea sp. NPDC050790 TaxID=3364371 RepID=UPI0037AFE49B